MALVLENDFHVHAYCCQLCLNSPCDDIWKKFDLLPTPPLSPLRVPSPTEVLSDSQSSDGGQSWEEFEEELLAAATQHSEEGDVDEPVPSFRNDPLLLQSLTYEPRGLGMYTPAVSPSYSLLTSDEEMSDSESLEEYNVSDERLHVGSKRQASRLDNPEDSGWFVAIVIQILPH